jgi:phosphoribosylformimino-5-aminoimidazole carboxamide ribotide isomerase
VKFFPAIDILEGRAVRLTQGEYERSKVYDEDPLRVAHEWCEQGARALHVVDLDGARSGRPVNLDHLERIARGLAVPVQYGGGLRTSGAIADAFAAGAGRVILGTAAINDPELLAAAITAHGDERIVVSVDVRAGKPATDGWTRTSDGGADELIAALRERGVTLFVYTDVDRDGMLSGVDTDSLADLVQRSGARLIYSGGVGSIDDLAALAALDLDGVIAGKALYERRFSIAEALRVLGD